MLYLPYEGQQALISDDVMMMSISSRQNSHLMMGSWRTISCEVLVDISPKFHKYRVLFCSFTFIPMYCSEVVYLIDYIYCTTSMVQACFSDCPRSYRKIECLSYRITDKFKQKPPIGSQSKNYFWNSMNSSGGNFRVRKLKHFSSTIMMVPCAFT